MYKYEFVRVGLKSSFFKDIPKEDYQEIIHSYAKNGWRFVQSEFFSNTGVSSYFELIFEKEV